MNQKQVERAEWKAEEIYDRWSEISGYIEPGTSLEFEVKDCIKDAVHIGIKAALKQRIGFDKDGNLIRCKFKEKK